jgi:hypothetical protein
VSDTLSADARNEILSACQRLSLDYSHYADHGQMDAFSELFGDEGELVVGGVATVGAKAIYKNLTSTPRGEVQSIHAVTNLRLDVVSPTEAKGVVYITAYVAAKKDGVGSAPVIAPMAVGQYEDVYRKTSDGWRFARRAFSPLIAAAPVS